MNELSIEELKARQRVIVLDDNEEPPEYSKYVASRKGKEGMEPLNFTPMRQKERFYRQNNIFDDAYDFRCLNEKFHNKITKIDLPNNRVAYKINDVSGLYIIPNYLSLDEQKTLLRNVFFDELGKKNKNSLDAVYNLPEESLSDLLQTKGKDYQLTLKRKDKDESVTHTLEEWIRKIRWINLGYGYNWNNLSYDFDSKMVDFHLIQSLSKQICSDLSFEIEPEAGIINYYQLKDSLTAHLDRSEKNMQVPLVSFSVGNSGVF